MPLLSKTAPDVPLPRHHDLLTGPPPEVLDEVAAAWERAQEPSPTASSCGSPPSRPWAGPGAELRLDDGELVTAISASEALAIACGDARMAVAV